MVAKHGLAYRPKKAKWIKVDWFKDSKTRDFEANAWRGIGFKTRKLTRKDKNLL